ncbi:MAG TPA: palindromic element RPE4 domain-containing protein [Rickettsia endosymbiont of Bembidion nr. Transversale]|nr:palindromic element RPE4 domain-containing protein [Rickettsia endosymbiont of Stiretrus anchorago]HJD65882.1 palindromic element RPE4 domain-containing protein [Rickettsia endosymbiont of Bembidion nr. Transversale]
MIYSRDPVKNTNKISIFYYFLNTEDIDFLVVFLDPVDKPRDDSISA